MSKIAMFTMGTRGDVQPYIYLSRALISHGYEVTLGSHPCWKILIEDAGIPFAPIGPDIDIEKEAAIIRGKNSNPAISMLKTMNFVFRIIQNSTDEIYKVCEQSDFVVVSHSQMGATEAEALGLPTVNVTLQKEMVAEKLKPMTLKDKLIGNMIGKQVAKPYNKIRKVYGLKPVKSADEVMSKDLNLIPISKYVLKRNPYWEEKNVLCGYWFDQEQDYTPPEELKDFLSKGDAPVILALGAMSFEERPEVEKLDMFVKAFEKAGVRALIQGFQKSLKDYKLPDTMMAIGSVPHSYLFPKGKFAIHHCGFGTSSATLAYGIPSIPVPHVLDQMGFGQQLFDAGVAVQPLKSKDLSEQSIYEAIKEMLSAYDEKKQAALEISEKIQSENGLETAVSLIAKLIPDEA